MTVVVTHTTPSDGTFSAAGAAAWDATHTLSGVGTMAEQNANNVAITGGTISGVTLPAAGSTLQIQYNNAGAFAGMSGTSWDDANRSLVVSGATITANAPVMDLSQTWNNAAVTFTGYTLNVTDTASNASSLLMDLQVGGVSRLKALKGGYLLVGNPAAGFSNTGIMALGASFGTVGGSTSVVSGEQLGFHASSTKVGEYIFGLRLKNNSAFTFEWSSTGLSSGATDLVLGRRAAANLRFGAADAAAPVAQTLSVQSVVAGTSSIAGADWTFTGSQSTGAGAAGNLVLSTGFANTVNTATVTITIAAPAVITWTAHGLVTGSPVVFTTTGALPTGITAGTTYYAITNSTLGVNTFQIATSAANAAAGTTITTSGTQSGVQTATTSATVQNPTMVSATFGPSGLTGSQATSLLNLSQTWNTTGTPTALKVNVTDTASNASSLLMDLQTGGTSKIRITKTGAIISAVGSNGASGFYVGNTTENGIYSPNNQQLYLSGGGTIIEVRNSGLGLGSNPLSWGSIGSVQDLFLTRRAAANLRFGAADAAAPVAQTLSVQSVVAGTTNTAGANLTITGSQGTGTGAGGSIVFQVAPAGTTGTAQNALVSALTIDSAKNATFGNGLIVQNGGGGSTGIGFGNFASGFYMPGSSSIYAMNSSNVVFEFGVSYAQVTSVLSFGSAGSIGDTRLYRDAANTLAQRNGVNAQTKRLYGTYTDASNYRRLAMTMSAAGVAEIKPEGGGTGASGNVLYISGLPTSNPGPGILWNNAGTPAIGT